MTVRARHVIPALAVGVALAGAGCGSSSEEEPQPGPGLPQSFVEQIEPRLDEVQRRYDDGIENGNVGACEDIADSFEEPGGIEEILSGLPDDVDPDLRRAVERSIERLRSLTEDCVEQAEAAAPEPEVEPEPVPVEPPPEETTTQETTPDEEPEEDEGNGGQDDGGSNNGGSEQPAPAPNPEPAPTPQQPEAAPPGQDGGLQAPPARGRQGAKQPKSPKG